MFLAKRQDGQARLLVYHPETVFTEVAATHPTSSGLSDGFGRNYGISVSSASSAVCSWEAYVDTIIWYSQDEDLGSEVVFWFLAHVHDHSPLLILLRRC